MGCPSSVIGSHQEVLSRVLIRTAEEYSGSRPGAPEPLAPMPGKGRKTTQQADIQELFPELNTIAHFPRLVEQLHLKEKDIAYREGK